MRILLAALALAGLCAGAAVAGPRPARPAAVKQVDVTVTSDGFQPAEIQARAGEPLRLVVTRTTERTCAKELVIKDLGIDRPLPLNVPVTIELRPTKSGQLRYACAMDMVSGVIIIP